MNVLIVDDDAIERMAIKRELKKQIGSHTITDIDNAYAALEAIENQQFDILLLDYKMPLLNGLEFILKVKHLPKSNDIAIVIISNYSDEETMLECINAGAQDFLLKEEVNASRLSRAMLQARKRFELEQKLYDSYQQVKRLAEHDNLTGLSNRYHFEESLRRALESWKRTRDKVAVLLFDLDHFKKINDNFGHEAGDKLLQQVADRVQHSLRTEELFARLGGDEFALIIEDIQFIHQVKMISSRIMSTFKQPFDVNGTEVYCSGSMGISICPVNGEAVNELIKYADIAMYRAKNSGRNQICLFEDNMQKEFYRKYKIEQEMRKAVKSDAFELHYQPIIASGNNQIKGIEALIRWPNAAVQTYPDEFIPIAEESKLIEELGVWVLSKAVEQASQICREVGLPLFISINLSPIQLQSIAICKALSSVLKIHKVLPENVMLEITETALLDNSSESSSVISSLSSMGCRIALDDFGTGYSSISHLLQYPIDVVKLHKSLIDGASINARHFKIMKGLCEMFNDVDIDIVAEGIEEVEQLKICEQCHVTFMQGYHFAKPLAKSVLIEFLNELQAADKTNEVQ